MAKIKSRFVCQNCGYETVKWMGKCPDCGSFSSFAEEIAEKTTGRFSSPIKKGSSASKLLNEITATSEDRMSTGMGELDRVLGGGLVKGSLTLVGGDPGIGKSTLILQICQKLGEQNKKILYVSGEESPQQIKMRADRLCVTTPNLYLLSETNIALVEANIEALYPDFVIIDSIQTMYMDDVSSAPGSVTQVREATSRIMHIGKGKGITVIVVGHVTKEGAIAGPRILEHMVDTVLYFEGDKTAAYRLLRAVKNRFGATNEIGVFEMASMGLREILNPSEYMLSGRPKDVSGSVVTCSMEGSRPLLIEVQSLVSFTSFNMPRRMATGMDFNRVVLLIAVLEKRAGLQLGSYDCYVNITGGMRVCEPSLDAAVVAAVASSYRNVPIKADTIVFGEIGLTGETRAVAMAEKRVAEAKKLGFKKCVLPSANLKEAKRVKDIEIVGVSTVYELLETLL
ncbi:MAG: DNA repair protein RadA [Lachnospirales bacterium]